MELADLKGNIIGLIIDNYKDKDYSNKKVSDIVLKKPEDSLKMVNLNIDILDKKYDDLSINYRNKVVLASKLFNDVIILKDFTRGLNKKEIEFYKSLFKKLVNYNKRIILIDNNSELFINCVDKIYVINNDDIMYETNDIYDKNLINYIDIPKIVEFTNKCENIGIKINHYQELDELLKAIYRIKS